MQSLIYLGTEFHIDFCDAGPDASTKVAGFLGDYFETVPRAHTPAFRVVPHLRDGAMLREILEFGHPVTIHNSKKPSVHETGVRLDLGLQSHVFNRATKGVYSLNRFSREAHVYNSDPACLARDTIRISRDLAKLHVEQRHAGILLHSAAVVSPSGHGLLLLGDKGSGKTTVMLELIYTHGYREVSRDRTFVVSGAGGRWLACGFPNYYNLTARTIRNFGKTRHLLSKALDQLDDRDLDQVNEKWQCLPDDIGIDKSMRVPRCELHKIICLETAEADVNDVLSANCFSPFDPNYPNWHDWASSNTKTWSDAFDRAATQLRELRPLVTTLRWKHDLRGAVAALVRMTHAEEGNACSA